MSKKNKLKLWSTISMLSLLLSFPSCKNNESIPTPPLIEPPQVTPVSLSIDTKFDSQLMIDMSEDSIYTLQGRTGNADPYFLTNVLKEDASEECCVLEFEYKLKETIDNLEIFFITDLEGNVDAAKSGSFGSINASPDNWTTYSVRLKKSRSKFDWGHKGEKIRIDIGSTDRTYMHIKNMKLRVMNEEELKEEEAEDNAENEKKQYEQSIKDYLEKDFSCHITKVSVTGDQITISGNYTGEGTYFLAELPTFVDLFKVQKIEEAYKIPLKQTSFTERTARFRTVDDYTYDGLLSRWAIFKEGTEKDELVSHARYADDIPVVRSIEALNPSGKKGLGGIINSPKLEADIRDLGITSATINVCPMLFMHAAKQAGDIEHGYNGKTYYFNLPFIEANLDAPLKIAAQYNVAVAGILLLHPASTGGTDPQITSILQHPDYSTKGVYTMPNTTTVESTDYYAAILDFLAERYSKKEQRITHWIIHNEVDAGVNWVNMGDVATATFMETYMRSVRMCYNIVHQYDQNARVYIPFTHGWTKSAGGGWYAVTDMLNMMNQYSRAEGDFFWAPACHSYPEGLAEPRVWNDKNATFSMSSQYVTLKNLEVLDKWVQTPANQYKGSQKRLIWLSEAGTGTSVTPTEEDNTAQAAGFAYGWKKINALEGIEGIQWHNWYDNPAEAVLLGLRFQDGTGRPEAGQPKPVWHTYQKAGTAEEEEYFKQYLDFIGIPDWGIIENIPD